MATRKPKRGSRSKAKKGKKRAAPKGRARAGARKKAAPRRKASAPSRSASRERVPSGIGLSSHHMDYTSHDVDGVKRFYTEILGFKQFRHDTNMNYVFIQTGTTSSLGFMPPMPGPPEQWRPPREPALYFMVQNVDRAHRELLAKGVTFEQEPQDMPWGHRVAMVRDPEGRTVCLAQALRR